MGMEIPGIWGMLHAIFILWERPFESNYAAYIWILFLGRRAGRFFVTIHGMGGCEP